MAGKRRWGLIILGLVLFLVIVGVAVLGTVGYLMYRQFDVQTVTTEDPSDAFARVEARFANQQPLVEFPEGPDGKAVVHEAPGNARVQALTSLHVLAWSPSEKKLVRFSMPFWLLRLGGSHPIHLQPDSGASWIFDSERVNLTPEDIERHGPGLIVRHTTPRGERVIVWAD
jgi:hypothetical protein